MPVIANESVTYEVSNITINGDGSCAVNVEIKLGSRLVENRPAALTAAEAAPVWSGIPPAGTQRWPDLKGQLYGILQAKGVIPS